MEVERWEMGKILGAREREKEEQKIEVQVATTFLEIKCNFVRF